MKQLYKAFLLFALSISAAWAQSVDINRAGADEIAAAMVGVGDTKAEAIVAYRDELGPFLTVNDLVLVKGIGPATLEKNKDRLTVSLPRKK